MASGEEASLPDITQPLCHAKAMPHPPTTVLFSCPNDSFAVEFEEWGNPKNASYYSYIKSYAPVDNVRAQR
jgi:hypothetical protein